MNKKAFTLIEILAVIVVLGIIAVITISVIVGIIDKTRMKAYEVAAKNVIDAAKEYVTRVEDNNDFPEGGIRVEDIDLKKDKYISGKVYRDSAGVITLENLSDGNYCANGSKQEITVSKAIDGKCVITSSSGLVIDYLRAMNITIDSFEIYFHAQDFENGIKAYSYCYKECDKEENYIKKEFTEDEKNNGKTLNINNLKPGTEYLFKLRVYSDLEEAVVVEKEKSVKTLEIEEPTFAISSGSYTSAKILTITYPEDTNNRYTFGYIYGNNDAIFEENIKKIEIKENQDVIANVYKQDDKNTVLTTSKISIAGIDTTAPTTTVTITPAETKYNDGTTEWFTHKTVKAVAIDTGIGLAFRPFKFNILDKWVKTEQVYKVNSKLKLKTRDRLSNETEYFTVDGTSVNEYEIKSVDSTPPACEFTLTGTKQVSTNEWYTSNVTVDFTIKDKYVDINGNVVDGGAGLNSAKTLLYINGIKTKLVKKGTTDIYTYTVKSNGTTNIKLNVEDRLKNQGTCTQVVKKDSVKPALVKVSPPYVTYLQNKTLISFFNITTNYGASKGTTTCYIGETVYKNVNELTKAKLLFGVNNIKCVMRAGNGHVAEASNTIKHKYNATLYCSEGRVPRNKDCTQYYDSNLSKCGCALYNQKAAAPCTPKSYNFKQSCYTTNYYGYTLGKCLGDYDQYTGECIGGFEVLPACDYVSTGAPCQTTICRWVKDSVKEYEMCRDSSFGCQTPASCTLVENEYRTFKCEQKGKDINGNESYGKLNSKVELGVCFF